MPRMTRSPLTLPALLACSLLACATPNASAPRPPVVAEPAAKAGATTSTQLDADTTVRTGGDASFEAPKGWHLTRGADRIRLETPEHDLALTWLEIADAPDGEGAVAAAWKRVDPTFALAVKQAMHPPARDGWDAFTQVVYETPGGETRTAFAHAARKGTTHYVALVDGTNAALDRRGAQLMTAITTFKAKGVAEESLAGRPAHRFDDERAKRLVAFVEDAMAKSALPGAAIAIVQDGKVVFERGFGVREMGKPAPVTPSTLFMIGSTTKSLTTLMMARLVDRQKLGWETPVTELLPSFALADAETSKKVLVKHTVCACTGLPRQDYEFLFEHANVTPEMRMEAMRSMKPTTGFGETFQYSNSLVAAGGFVAGHVFEPNKALGPAYDAAMQTLVLDPLGMKSTTLDLDVASRREHASPHGEDYRGALTAMRPDAEGFVVPLRPAGGAWSSASDMTKILLLETSKGRDAAGGVFVTEENLLARRRPQVKITDKMSYGLGLFVEDDHGVSVVHHGGNALGFTSDLFVLPSSGVGAVVLTNAGGANTFRRVVRRRILELLFDAKEEAATLLEFGLTRKKDALAREAAKVGHDAWADAWRGAYTNEGLARVTLRTEGHDLTLDAGEWKSRVGTKKEADGTTKLVLLDAPIAGLELVALEENGAKILRLDGDQLTYRFVPAAPAPARAAH